MQDIIPLKDSLTISFLDVGDGDSIIVQLPEIYSFEHIVVDCKKSSPTIDWLDKIEAEHLALVVATHPHYDHIAGLKSVMKKFPNAVEQFWDSGFRHNSVTWFNLIDHITEEETNAQILRPTSGLYTSFNDVTITVLAPSIALRNRYDSYGVNINNASIVLKFEYGGKSVILGGDAQWDSWGKMTEEFPEYVKTNNPDQHVQVETTHKPLKCNVLKVAHHGSKHGTALEPVEVLKPNYAIIPCAVNSSYGFPHDITMMSLEEIGTKIIDTAKCGNVLVEIEADGSLNVYKNVIAISKNKFQGEKC